MSQPGLRQINGIDIDGKRHVIRVELLGEAKKKIKTTRLRYRTAYIPAITIPTWQH